MTLASRSGATPSKWASGASDGSSVGAARPLIDSLAAWPNHAPPGYMPCAQIVKRHGGVDEERPSFRRTSGMLARVAMAAPCEKPKMPSYGMRAESR